MLASEWAQAILATHHPSAALRAPKPDDRRRMRDELATDLKTASPPLNDATIRTSDPKATSPNNRVGTSFAVPH